MRASRSICGFVLALCVLGMACAAQAQDAPASLATRMGAAEFHRAGLDQLSPAQLAVLENWLAAHGGEPVKAAPAPAQESSATVAADRVTRGPDAKPKPARNVITSHVVGAFRGWVPGDVVVLANGQRWRIADDSSLDTGKTLDAPAVTIKPGLIGGWLLKVAGYNASARVQPVN